MLKHCHKNILMASIICVTIACSPGGFDNNAAVKRTEDPTKNPLGAGDVIPVSINDRSIEQVLCQEGPRVIGIFNPGDFAPQFSLICDGNNTNNTFKDLIRNSYQGNGNPSVQIVKSSTNAMFITNLALAFAIKVPLADPSQFADLEAHNIFSSGITTKNSKLVINVANRQPFPGRRSVEKVVLDYNLTSALGAGIHDTRRTEFNTYLLIEDNRDITISTEHLLDKENEYYHLANGLTIGLRADDGYSYLVFVTELIIKNRIDPERITNTIVSLNEQVATMLHSYISGS